MVDYEKVIDGSLSRWHWAQIRARQTIGPDPKYPSEMVNWYYWEYSGKGPRWPCWECRKYFRQLFMDKQPVDPPAIDYGISVQTKRPPTTTWQAFKYKWYCMDCVRKIGVIW
jgi:hypothetical protein